MKGYGLFSYDERSREFLVLGAPIIDSDIEETRKLHQDHLVPDYSERSLYQSLIFAITNQKTTYEQVTRFMHTVAGADLEYIKDANLVYEVAKHGDNKLGFKKNKYKEPFEFMESSGGIGKVVQSYLSDPYDFRKELRKVNWMGPKTAALWYNCIGGDESIMCIDVHLLRQCPSLGIELDKKYFIDRPRISKNGVEYRSRDSLPDRLYYGIEQRLLDIIEHSTLPEQYPDDLLNKHGRINGPFASLLMWWLTASDFRSKMRQLKLFPEARFENPYVQVLS
jgi:endonuclease III